MRFLFHTHSLISDWNHGNAHFLRGVMRDLNRRGHDTLALEPANAWSRENLLAERPDAVAAFHRDFPSISTTIHDATFDHEAALDAADVVIVHEWSDPALVARIGQARKRGGRFLLLFHDTHHRAVSASGEIGAMDLSGYDGVLAFGEALRERYLKAGWGRQVFTWHEAADDALFHPLPDEPEEGDLVWIGNWGDDERTAELHEFLIQPARDLHLRATVHGVRYPDDARAALDAAGIAYKGWLPNAEVPRAFAHNRVTVHVPRRPYVEQLPGIPTIRPFEALACGIPLVSAPWDDAEGLFRPGDFLWAKNGDEMRQHLRSLVNDPALRHEQAARGLQTIQARHTCRHRVDELLTILDQLKAPARKTA
ncbi:CgeB family protein [Rubellimicrobium aerolatum]|uniref:Glycosyltransferase n=1 Tax=Rubellimicrobium aerolatum TaxID=490979 RepID=A0ABW0S963_9RHOB|nr:glycosyltransferase [Rubellimicrobium aerolatum]MBP1804815.1 spore maturation protein CgeB [Rubellimicrobium aerolatum]